MIKEHYECRSKSCYIKYYRFFIIHFIDFFFIEMDASILVFVVVSTDILHLERLPLEHLLIKLNRYCDQFVGIRCSIPGVIENPNLMA